MQGFENGRSPAKSLFMRSTILASLPLAGALVSLFSVVLLSLTACSTKSSTLVEDEAALGSPEEVGALEPSPWEGEETAEIRVDLSAEATGESRVRLQIIAPDGASLEGGQVWVGGFAAVDESAVTLFRRGPIEIEGEEVVLESLPLGAFTVTAVSGELAGVSLLLVPVEHLAEQRAVLRLAPGRTIRGRVLSEAGEPPSSPVSLVLSVRDVELRVPVAEDGTFSHVVPTDKAVSMYAFAEGLASPTVRIGRDETLERPVTMRLRPMVQVTVQVLHDDGQPVPGAVLVLRWESLESGVATTDEGGMARFERVPPTRVGLEIICPMLEMSVPLTLEDTAIGNAEPPMIEVRLPALGAVSGRVLGEDGHAMGRVSVSARPAVEGAIAPKITPSSVLVDSPRVGRRGSRVVPSPPSISNTADVGAGGGFELTLPEGAWILRTTDRRSEETTVEVLAGKMREGVVIGYPPAAAATGGIVTFADGRPLSHHRIDCHPVDSEGSPIPNTEERPQGPLRTETDADGVFNLDRLRSRLEGLDRLACKPNRPPLAVLSGGRVRVEGEPATIVVQVRPTLDGQILDPGGQPLTRFEIAVSEGRGEAWRSVEDPEGRYSIPAPNHCSDEHCRIKVRSDEYPEKQASVPVDWRQASVDVAPLRMEAGVRLSGRIDLSGVDVSTDPVIVVGSEVLLGQISDERYQRMVLSSIADTAIAEIAEDGEFRLGPMSFNRSLNLIVLYVIRPGIAVEEHRLPVTSLEMDVGTLRLPGP